MTSHSSTKLVVVLYSHLCKTKLVSGLHIPSSVATYTFKTFAFRKPFLTTLRVKSRKIGNKIVKLYSKIENTDISPW